jgi:GT2 family glycosyltransferase
LPDLENDTLADARVSAFEAKVVVCEKASEAERLNFAVSQTDGDILCFVNANLKPLSKDWLAELVSFACQTEIGAVGAKLLYKDESVLHGGLIIGANGAVGAAHHRLPRDSAGSFLRARLVNNFSAVSISCLAVRREVFESVGGFDAKNLPDKFFDADLCLKLREQNYRIVFTPYAELIQIDEKKRLNLEKDPTAQERDHFAQKWQKFIGNDPFYNPNLSYKNGDFSIEI